MGKKIFRMPIGIFKKILKKHGINLFLILNRKKFIYFKKYYGYVFCLIITFLFEYLHLLYLFKLFLTIIKTSKLLGRQSLWIDTLFYCKE